ncbi:MAG TPA: D-alanyl-D-alanine carboxypeptidase family protein [Candidatus Saccharimonadales bacterium]|nr:D-alanyl-D-alanine carboxypeptidase family protein [Candidatus Saccharimonadales bacterium]
MKKVVLWFLFIIVAAGGFIAYKAHSSGSKTDSGKTTASHATGFDKSQHSLKDAGSLWVVVNKTRQLQPASYVPKNLVVPNIPLRSNITDTEKYVRADMAPSLEKMVEDANAQGVHFNLQSGYRSYQFQVDLYNSYVAAQGKSLADSQSARPG